MRLVINEASACAQSRFTAHRLITMRLRLMELWRSVTGGHNESLIIMAVVAITGDRLVRLPSASDLRNMTNAVPPSMLGKCNLSSIASATGLNRETVRRVVNRLMERGILERSADGAVRFTPGRMQNDNAVRISQFQLEEFTRTANELLKEGVLIIQDRQA